MHGNAPTVPEQMSSLLHVYCNHNKPKCSHLCLYRYLTSNLDLYYFEVYWSVGLYVCLYVCMFVSMF